MAEARRRRSVRVGVGVGLPLVAAVALVALLLRLFPVDATSQWGLFPAVVAGVCWAGQLWYVGYGLDPGRLTGGFWRRLLGLANVVTLVRGALYAVVAGFVVVPSETALAWGASAVLRDRRRPRQARRDRRPDGRSTDGARPPA